MVFASGETKGVQGGKEGGSMEKVNWVRVGANGLIGFATAAVAATALGIPSESVHLALLNALFQGLLALAVELKTQSSGKAMLPLCSVI